MANHPLDSAFSSLSDPTRRDILQRLLHGERSVNELAEAYDMSLPAVSKHLKVLEAARLIVKERRGRQQIVRLASKNLHDVTDHLLYYESALNKRLDSLEHYLEHKATSNTASKQVVASPTPKQTLVIVHTFANPRRRVWDAYTDPREIPHWWGSGQLKLLECSNDVRVGGVWRFAFRGVGGQDYVMSGRYLEVHQPSRLIYTDGFGEANSSRPEAVVTIDFEELAPDQTKLTKTSVALPATHQLQAAWLKSAQG